MSNIRTVYGLYAVAGIHPHFIGIFSTRKLAKVAGNKYIGDPNRPGKDIEEDDLDEGEVVQFFIQSVRLDRLYVNPIGSL
ncbi:MAG TPA: hypothetical protein VNX68_01025 [Nitrosopumilaceae archaeon]|jgi:hypothetical protein|nr:hypothetical protein [Nitrosopumilaceae archaeon]